MGFGFGSIKTDIVKDGLVFNMDAANRASYVPDATTSYNTINLNESGSFVSDPTYISPPTSASCWSFDGIDDGINIGSIGPQTGVTFNVWFKIGGADGSRAWGQIIGNWTSAASGQYLWIGTKLDEPDEIQVYFDGANKFSFPDQPFQTWRCLTFTHDSDNSIFGYINGIQTNTGTDVSRTISGVTALGYDVNRDNYPFLGEIANLHIYNRALSASEVLRNYNGLKGRFGL
jgi:hypothetical protein